MLFKNKVQFVSLQQVMNAQINHFLKLLFYLNLNHFQYPFSPQIYFKNKINLFVFVTKKVNIWSTSFFLLFNYFYPTSVFLRVIEKSLGIGPLDKVLLMTAVTTSIQDHLSNCALQTICTTSNHPTLTLLYEYSVFLGLRINLANSRKLLSWYARMTSFSVLYKHFLNAFFAYCAVIFTWYLSVFFKNGLISALEVSVYVYFSVIFCWVATIGPTFGANIFVDLTCTVKVLKVKLQRAKFHLRLVPLTGRQSSELQFSKLYSALHRELNMLNVFASKFYFSWDISVKISISVLCTVFLFQTNAGNIKEETVNSAFAQVSVLLVCTGAYFGMNFSMLYLAYFPCQSAKMYALYNRVMIRRVDHHNSLLKQNKIASFREFKLNLKVNSMVAILGKDKLSFSYSSFFPITKLSIAENVVANAYLMLLLYLQFVIRPKVVKQKLF